MSFVDRVSVQIVSGKGGRGAVSFRREKFVAKGGPDGGDGGRGGHVYVQGSHHLETLLDLRYKNYYKAGTGEDGKGKRCFGANGKDVVIRVPIGVQVIDTQQSALLADIIYDGQSVLIAEGGDGGKGNWHYRNSVRQTPYFYQDGFEGEELTLSFELKTIADVGFVGVPNAGKSSLLRALTEARPQVASYPFTTKHPHIGVLSDQYGEFIRLVDIPGIIEEAHSGAGMGLDFLRHVSRARCLIFVLGMDSEIDKDPYHNLELLMNEINLYDSQMIKKKKFCIFLNKQDISIPSQQLLNKFKKNWKEIPVLSGSAQTKEGLSSLINMLWDMTKK